MSVLQSDIDELEIRTEITCEKCGYVWDTESEMPRVTCPSCQRKTSRESARRIATVSTKYIGPKGTIAEVADLLEERAEAVRALYEDGWSTNSGIDSLNCIHAITEDDSEDGSDAERPPITEEQWRADGERDASTGIGMIDYVVECPSCESEFTVDQDDWKMDGKIVAENEVFCYSCEKSVKKNLVGIEFTHYPKERFRHTHDLRRAALNLRGLSAWLRGLDEHGWYLDESIDGHLRLRYGVTGEDDFTLDSRGHLERIEH